MRPESPAPEEATHADLMEDLRRLLHSSEFTPAGASRLLQALSARHQIESERAERAQGELARTQGELTQTKDDKAAVEENLRISKEKNEAQQRTIVDRTFEKEQAIKTKEEAEQQVRTLVELPRHAQPTSTLPEGLVFTEIPGNGHCQFTAAGLFLGKSAEKIREEVAKHLADHKEELMPRSLFANDEAAYDRHVISIRDKEWGDHLELGVMQRLYQRHIVVIYENDPPLCLILDEESDRHDPIFLYYRPDHYDAFIIAPGFNGREILHTIQTAVKENPDELIVYSPAGKPLTTTAYPSLAVLKQRANKTTLRVFKDHKKAFIKKTRKHLAKLGFQQISAAQEDGSSKPVFYETLEDLLKNRYRRSQASSIGGQQSVADNARKNSSSPLLPGDGGGSAGYGSPEARSFVQSLALPKQAEPSKPDPDQYRVLLIESSGLEEYPPTPKGLTSDAVHFSHTWISGSKERSLNRFPEIILDQAERAVANQDRRQIFVVLKITDNYYPLESTSPAPNNTKKICSLIGGFIFFLAFTDAFGHGMLNVAQLTKSDIPDKEWPSGGPFIRFLGLALLAGIPKFNRSYDSLHSLHRLRRFIGSDAFLPRSMSAGDKVVFFLWTVLTASIDGGLTYGAVQHLTKTPWLAGIIAAIDAIQFIPRQGVALANEFNRPLWEADYDFLCQRLRHPGLKIETLMTRASVVVTTVNLMLLMGMASVTFLAADKVQSSVSDVAAFSERKWLLTFVASTLYLAYNLSLYGTEIKTVLYSAINRAWKPPPSLPANPAQANPVSANPTPRSSSAQRASKTRLTQCGFVALKASALILLLLGSAFLNTITVQVGTAELFNLEAHRHPDAWRLSYFLASMFGVMAFSRTGVPLIRRAFHLEKPHKDTPSGSRIKEIYTVKRGLNDFAKGLFLAAPLFGFKLFYSSLTEKKRLYSCLTSGLFFIILYDRRLRLQHKNLGVPFVWFNLSCLAKDKYKYLIKEAEPSSTESDQHPNCVFIYDKKGHVYYKVRDPKDAGRFIDKPLLGDNEAVESIEAIFREQADGLTKAKEEPFSALNDKVQVNITENIFSGNPHLVRSIVYGLTCASLFFGALNIAQVITRHDELKLTADLVGVSIASLLGVLLLKNTAPHISDKGLIPDEPRCFTQPFERSLSL